MGSPIILIVMIVLMVVMFVFSSRSNKKKQREEQQLRDSLRPGDEVTTIGGIIGKVHKVHGDTFILETTKERTQIRFHKAAIRSIDVKVDDIVASVEEESNKVDAPAANETVAADTSSDFEAVKTEDTFADSDFYEPIPEVKDENK